LVEDQADIRLLLQRNFLELKRAAGLVEQPKTPILSRRRPLE
jgi:hypothetical protein